MADLGMLQPPAGDKSDPPQPSYATLLKTDEKSSNSSPLKLKPVTFVHRKPTITFDSNDLDAYIKEENLEFALIANFYFGQPDLQDIRRSFAQQFNVKGECLLGLICARHILMRFNLKEDFISVYSKSVTSINLREHYREVTYSFRIQRWTSWLVGLTIRRNHLFL
ncbi:unnamed protein product [Withania somnifera]